MSVCVCVAATNDDLDPVGVLESLPPKQAVTELQARTVGPPKDALALECLGIALIRNNATRGAVAAFDRALLASETPSRSLMLNRAIAAMEMKFNALNEAQKFADWVRKSPPSGDVELVDIFGCLLNVAATKDSNKAGFSKLVSLYIYLNDEVERTAGPLRREGEVKRWGVEWIGLRLYEDRLEAVNEAREIVSERRNSAVAAKSAYDAARRRLATARLNATRNREFNDGQYASAQRDLKRAGEQLDRAIGELKAARQMARSRLPNWPAEFDPIVPGLPDDQTDAEPNEVVAVAPPKGFLADVPTDAPADAPPEEVLQDNEEVVQDEPVAAAPEPKRDFRAQPEHPLPAGLRRGMSSAEVTGLLGAPKTRVQKAGQTVYTWITEQKISAGIFDFGDDEAESGGATVTKTVTVTFAEDALVSAGEMLN